jgi:hypothetical protein
MLNQALSDQRQASNLDRQTMLSCAKQVIIHTIKMNALKTGSLKPSDWILNPF